MIHWSNELKRIKAQIGDGVVNVDGAQTITGLKTFNTPEGEKLKLSGEGATPAEYIGFYGGNTRIGYLGYPSSSNSDFEINNQSPNGNIILSATKTIISNPVEFGTSIKAGIGASTVYFTPEDNSTKTLKMYSETQQNGFFNIDMGNKGQINALKAPSAPNQAATKAYVDSRYAYGLGAATTGIVAGQEVNLGYDLNGKRAYARFISVGNEENTLSSKSGTIMSGINSIYQITGTCRRTNAQWHDIGAMVSGDTTHKSPLYLHGDALKYYFSSSAPSGNDAQYWAVPFRIYVIYTKN